MIPGENLPVLTTERLRLRPLAAEDEAALFEIFSDPEVMRYWSSTPWESRSDAAKYIERIRRHFGTGDLYQWGVARREDDRVIGTGTLAHVDAQNRRAEIGFALRRDHWGRGWMLEATTALVDFAFGELRLHRLEADVDPRNEASLRLLERLGFSREGYMRERWLVGAEVNDTVFLGLLASEWHARRSRS